MLTHSVDVVGSNGRGGAACGSAAEPRRVSIPMALLRFGGPAATIEYARSERSWARLMEQVASSHQERSQPAICSRTPLRQGAGLWRTASSFAAEARNSSALLWEQLHAPSPDAVLVSIRFVTPTTPSSLRTPVSAASRSKAS